MKLQPTHLDHCSVIITDVTQSRRFYGDLLGLEEIPAPKTFDFVAIWYKLGRSFLHLLLKPNPDTISPRHYCIHVPDIQEARRLMKEKGIAIEETVKIPAAQRFFVRDPDGNRIEIFQWEREYIPSEDGRYLV